MKRIALALVLVALPAAAWADGDYRWELTPHISYHGNSSFHSSDADGYGLRIDEGGALGLMFDIPLSNNLQLELLLNAQASDLFSQNQLITGPDVKLANIDITYAHVGLLAQFGRREVTPYVVVSAGMTRLDPDLPGVGVDDRFSASLGAGVKLFILPFLGLRLEGRAFWTDIDGFGDENTTYRSYLSQGQVTAGVIFAW
jgi:opacity protein-like surface antigen